MRAALGLALAAGGVVLALMILHGRTPFDSTSGSSGSAPASDTANRGYSPYSVLNPTAASQIQHFGGMP